MVAFASPAAAVPSSVMFDFNNNGALPNCACADATNQTIASYMTSMLVSQGFKNVFVYMTGGIGQMGLPANDASNAGPSYNGEGHAIYDPNGKRVVTLADTEGYKYRAGPGGTNLDTNAASAYDSGAGFVSYGTQSATTDGYVKNCTSVDSPPGCSGTGYAIADSAGVVTPGTWGSGAASNHVLLGIGTYDATYANGFGNYLTDGTRRYQIESIDFDYQLFPDGSCTDNTDAACGGSGHPNLPELTVYAGTTQSVRLGGQNLTPGEPGFEAEDRSPGVKSFLSSSEQSPQGLGVASLTAPINTVNSNVFDFVDWPATIAFDNFNIKTKDLPEPSTLILFGFGLLGLAGIARRRRTKPVA